MMILQDEGTYRGDDPAERSKGVHGREHVQHRDPESLPHHFRRPLEGMITIPLNGFLRIPFTGRISIPP